ncbi:MAG: helix-turn-helix transcriptional regulator [Ekhidna sp.]|uniref:helix-turn-helix transcriptional regulator n=1 Tax=Ekhidna sp. TaxID=2608089 RepID=UPI0032EFFB2D
MRYESFQPSEDLKELVKEYWIFESDDLKVSQQKIIPDGFSEIIIHYGDPYRINLSGQWGEQKSLLFSSQISKYFFLENTGKSGMLGIKLYPTAFHELFQLDVSELTDQVLPLDTLISGTENLVKIQNEDSPMKQKVELAESWLKRHLPNLNPQEKIRTCISQIHESHGMIDMDQMACEAALSARQLERLFKKVIGLTPKFYCRIIRFNYIFDVIKDQNDSWVRTALKSGYFDQSHFIKNFKEFTGEEPSNYGFDEVNLANFFLRK